MLISREPQENNTKNNAHIGHTTTLSRWLPYFFSDTSAIKQHIITFISMTPKDHVL